MERAIGRTAIGLIAVGLVIAGVVIDLALQRDDFPSSAVVMAAFVAVAFLTVRQTVVISLLVAVSGVCLAVIEYDGAGQLTRIAVFVLAPAVAVVISVIRTRREAEVGAARVVLARRDAEIAEAHRFQRALLPRQLPSSDAYRLCSRYRAASVDEEVGGDWFDAVATDDALTLIIGDVAGSGLDAAATMAAARHATAMGAIGASPAEVLDAANGYVRRFPDTMATCLVVRFDLRDGTAAAASAGHPPIVVAAAGQARLAVVPPGLPLGVADGHRYEQYAVTVPPGATVVLYTDGLVERRSVDLDVALAKLLDVVRRCAHDQIERLCDRVLAEFDPSDDDVAVLVVRFDDRS